VEMRYVHAPTTPPTHPAAPPEPAASAAAPVAVRPAAAARAEEEGLHQVRSPIVGTFYEAPSPGAPPLVRVGDQVTAGQVLCIIEAMKLMNEIESDVAGEIVKKFVSNGQPVEYGQPLFAVRAAK
ncbi:MAG: acetyl-CoA carboxylase biotin carboxyl carrier protein, partial [Pseudomonadota bacterium]